MHSRPPGNKLKRNLATKLLTPTLCSTWLYLSPQIQEQKSNILSPSQRVSTRMHSHWKHTTITGRQMGNINTFVHKKTLHWVFLNYIHLYLSMVSLNLVRGSKPVFSNARNSYRNRLNQMINLRYHTLIQMVLSRDSCRKRFHFSALTGNLPVPLQSIHYSCTVGSTFWKEQWGHSDWLFFKWAPFKWLFRNNKREITDMRN